MVVGFGAMVFDVVASSVVAGFGVVDCAQTFKPSAQLCSKLGSQEGPHFPRHDPPLQQVGPYLLGTQFAHSEKCMMFFIVNYQHV